jgi:DnaJ-class molecular chaperone
MLKELELTREESLPERKRVFRKLQRELHPDKNVDCEEEAKLAFQELMLQRSCYLRP